MRGSTRVPVVTTRSAESPRLRRPMLYPVELRARDSREHLTQPKTERKPSEAAPICRSPQAVAFVQALCRRGVPPAVAMAALRRLDMVIASVPCGPRREAMAEAIAWDALDQAVAA